MNMRTAPDDGGGGANSIDPSSNVVSSAFCSNTVYFARSSAVIIEPGTIQIESNHQRPVLL